MVIGNNFVAETVQKNRTRQSTIYIIAMRTEKQTKGKEKCNDMRSAG